MHAYVLTCTQAYLLVQMCNTYIHTLYINKHIGLQYIISPLHGSPLHAYIGYMHTYTHVCMHAYIYKCMHAYMYGCMLAYIWGVLSGGLCPGGLSGGFLSYTLSYTVLSYTYNNHVTRLGGRLRLYCLRSPLSALWKRACIYIMFASMHTFASLIKSASHSPPLKERKTKKKKMIMTTTMMLLIKDESTM